MLRVVSVFLVELFDGQVLIHGALGGVVEFLAEVLLIGEVGLSVGLFRNEARDAVEGKEVILVLGKGGYVVSASMLCSSIGEL